MSDDRLGPEPFNRRKYSAMIGDTNKSAFLSDASLDPARATSQALATEFAHAIVLASRGATVCQTNWAKTDPEGTVLHLDTNGRPLREWDD
jgi:hypothetical protein